MTDDVDLTPGTQVKKLPNRGSKLGGAVPVRFNSDTIDRIKSQADLEGRTVSSWIRNEIEEALTQREMTVINFPTNAVTVDQLRRRLEAASG